MVENDTDKDHLSPLKSQHQAAQNSLITQERTQKLELLMHLLANLTQALVVCGPKGIGKTTLLAVMQERHVKSWQFCSVKGSAGLSFEAIQTQLASALSQDKSQKQAQALSAQMALAESQKQKIVLIVDDAGVLIPGLITSLIQYAAANPVLRLIFVLTHDELHMKSRSDAALEDCHVIEIPPLSETQCGEFLRYLSGRPNIQLAFNAISDDMIETIYRETHGIPGRIIAELPQIAAGSRQIDNTNWLLPGAVLVLVAAALALQWFSARQNTQDEGITPAVVEQTGSMETAQQPALPVPLAIDLSGHKVELPATLLPEGTSEESLSLAEANVAQKVVSDQRAQKSPPTETQPVAVKNEPATQPDLILANQENQQPKPENTENLTDSQQTTEDAEFPPEPQQVQDGGWQWLSVQPETNYTLQLMVLSKQQSIAAVLKKYPALAPDARTVKKVSKGKERFVLLYGSFASAASALEAKAALPAEFRSAMARKTSALKNELKPAGQP